MRGSPLRRSASAALSTAVSITLLSGFWAASPAQAATSGATSTNPTGAISLNSTGTVDGNGFVTLSGTYRCSAPAPSPAGMVRVHSSAWGPGIGEVAVCDGADHTWVHRDRPGRVPLVTVGQIQAVANLERWESAGGWNGFPKITTFAIDQKTVDLQAAAG
ncbi:DUF6299 family protein [Kitasatospora sp. NPDC058170]|uniref:DUF6299 family protein n=1 Tax=Kitasatospora sp. NPDC058170 TaxID=3346364 RepID=UPI0036DA8AD3